jgi:hypothetical protein
LLVGSFAHLAISIAERRNFSDGLVDSAGIVAGGAAGAMADDGVAGAIADDGAAGAMAVWCSKYDNFQVFFLSHFSHHFLSYFSYFFYISFLFLIFSLIST